MEHNPTDEFMPKWKSMETILTPFEQKVKSYRLLYGEGLFHFGHTSKSTTALPGVSAIISLIAGQKIHEADVQPALLKRARVLTAPPAQRKK